MSHFIDNLLKEIEKKTPICVGLDPHLSQVPDFIKQKYADPNNPNESASMAILEFNKGIIDAVKDLVPVVKPQVAFYEQYGPEGMRVYAKTIQYTKENGLMVLADVKRGDIGSTSSAYAKAYFDEKAPFLTDAITINTYFGEDSVKPYYSYFENGHAVFTQVKNSNPSSSEFQDLDMGDQKAYEVMGSLVEKWGEPYRGESGFSPIGAVVGATFPEQAARLRELMPHTFFLVPGYGAQGGGAADVKPCFNENGQGAIVNSSRGIIFAYQKDEKYSEENYKDAARDAVLVMKADLENVL